MFPVSDVIPSRTTPYVTISLIALNAIAFLIEFQLSDAGLHRLVATYGVVPAHFTWPDVLTSMFLHSGWLHVLGNMLYLWIFGDNVEDRMGHGAIAGVMGAYFVLYPQSRVLTAVFIVIFMDLIEIPAIYFLGIWFLMQLFSGVGSLGARAADGGVAFWAHVAGFAAGALIGALWRAAEPKRKESWNEMR
jgi:membrane associated rhomboid family serine protease